MSSFHAYVLAGFAFFGIAPPLSFATTNSPRAKVSYPLEIPEPDRTALAKLHGPFRTASRQGSPNSSATAWTSSRSSEYASSAILIKVHLADSISTSRGKMIGIESAADAALRILGKRFVRKVEKLIGPHSPTQASTSAHQVPIRARLAKESRLRGLDRWHRVQLGAGMSVDEALRLLARDSAFEAVEPDFEFRTLDVGFPSADTDPRYRDQWHLEAARVPPAWEYLRSVGLSPGGNRDVVVAIIDTGIDYTHPDIAANMWSNAQEVEDGLDNDGNGYQDDIFGIDVTSDVAAKRGDPMDDQGHGTHVAGIIAAQAQNGVGGVGVAYNVRVMAIKAAQYSGVLASSQVAQALYYAVENGADVINMSFGGYGYSSLMDDALAVAFNQAVLVAAAGNDSRPNSGECGPMNWGVMYPAGHNWVLGVMAEQQTPDQNGDWLAPFSNWDCIPGDEAEYEVMAPGISIVSTLPGGNHSVWSGTSMAAPVVSGIAALLRSRWADKDTHSSRFIMGQLASTGAFKQGRTDRLTGVSKYFRAVDALSALTNNAKPSISYLQHWVFDSDTNNSTNDDDGVVDAGETVDLAIELRNQWGAAAHVTATLDAWVNGALGNDPFVTMNTDTAYLGSLGAFSQKDTGLIREPGGAIVGVTNALRFTVSTNAPNDHLIPFRLRITASNGLDITDKTLYAFEDYFFLRVQKGKQLPSVITNNMVLDSSSYWIIDRPVLIPQGVTVTITEGAQVQFWSSQPGHIYASQLSPYVQVEGGLIVSGTAARPVSFFPSNLYPNHALIVFNKGGFISFNYFTAVNPLFGSPKEMDNEYAGYELPQSSAFDSISYGRVTASTYLGLGGTPWSTIGPRLLAKSTGGSICNTAFYNCGSDLDSGNRYAASLVARAGNFRRNLLDSCTFREFAGAMSDISETVFLRNYNPAAGPLPTSFTMGGGAVECGIRQNAILNEWWRTDIQNYWARFLVPVGRGTNWFISSNYWGTTSRSLIGMAIWDGSDDFNKGAYVYEPILETAPESCWPFVVGVQLSTASTDNVVAVGAEQVTFTVAFNRDMDTNVNPQVSFGPSMPYTDFNVRSQEGWTDARTWRGSARISPMTGDGWQYIRVADAVAADDPWLVSGNDYRRFRFEVKTSGVEALNLNATGGEGFVDLSWIQDDFDMLAGYNLYRSTTVSGSFTRVNAYLIPREQKSWHDSDVQPGQAYYYKFTVVKTDLVESQPSNVAVATPLDTIAPTISHTPIATAPPNLSVTVAADVTDNVAVQSAKLFFRWSGDLTYQERMMVKTTGNRYTASLVGAEVTAPGVDYYIQASDGITTTRSGRAEAPYHIVVVDRPVITNITPASGPSTGGTSLTLSGSNFKPGATVTFGSLGGQQAIVLDQSRITCTTPQHPPVTVDVKVTNTNGESHVLLKGFTFQSDAVAVSLPSLHSGRNTYVEIPLLVENANGIAAADVTVAFNPTVLRLVAVRKGSLLPNWNLVFNTNTPGTVLLSLASPGGTVSGNGSLATFEFYVIGNPADQGPLIIESAVFNDGVLPTQRQNGTFIVDATYSIAGRVSFWKNAETVSNVVLSLQGSSSLTQTNGATGGFVLQGVNAGSYLLRPLKSDEVSGITSYDASLILQHAVGATTLTGPSATAADVNRSGLINSMDAYLVLQKAAQAIDVPFSGAGVVWAFSPEQRYYSDLQASATEQDFSAALLGDVSGNWSATGLSMQSRELSWATNILYEVQVPRAAEWIARVLMSNGSNLVQSLDLQLRYNTNAVLERVVPGPMLQDFTYVFNTAQAGTVRAAIAGPSGLSGTGPLLTLHFRGDAPSRLEVDKVLANEGRYSVEQTFDLTSFDSDGDGLIDVDEREVYMCDPQQADTSGDGISDGIAVRLGLEPGNPRSVFASLVTSGPGGLTLHWPSRPGNTYYIEYSETLGTVWKRQAGPILAENYLTSVTFAPPAEPRFYRVLFTPD